MIDSKRDKQVSKAILEQDTVHGSATRKERMKKDAIERSIASRRRRGVVINNFS